MTREEIFEIIKEVFSDFNPTCIDKRTYSKIRIDEKLEAYTYSKLPDSDSIWYFSCFFDGHSHETQIPRVSTKQFIKLYLEVYKDVVTATKLLDSVNSRLREINSKDYIRDIKIKTICGE